MAPFDTVLITNTVFGIPLPSAQFGPDSIRADFRHPPGFWKPHAISALIPSSAAGRPSEAMHASHPAPELDVRRRAGVDEALGLSDRPFVELGDPARERFDERIQLGVRKARWM
jgi:hypothetical protein